MKEPFLSLLGFTTFMYFFLFLVAVSGILDLHFATYNFKNKIIISFILSYLT